MTALRAFTYGKHSAVLPMTTFASALPLRDADVSMASYQEPTRTDLVARIREAMRAEADGDTRYSDELAQEFGIFHGELLSIAALPSAREDIRAHAAKVWVRTLYPPPIEDMRSSSRKQTKYPLPPQFIDLLVTVTVTVTVPPLVKLGILAGLDDVADFNLIKQLMELVPDESFQCEAQDVLAEVA